MQGTWMQREGDLWAIFAVSHRESRMGYRRPDSIGSKHKPESHTRLSAECPEGPRDSSKFHNSSW